MRILFLLALTLPFITCCEDKQVKGGKKNKDIVVAISDSYPPFEYLDKATGEIVGFDIDLIKKMANEGDFNIVMQNMHFESIIPSLKHNDIDMAVSAISPENFRVDIDFSIPYYATPLVLIFNTESPVSSIEELRGKKIGVQGGTIMYNYIKRSGYKDIQKVIFDSYQTAIDELKKRRIDAVLIEDCTAAEYIKNRSGVAILKLPSTVGSYSIAFPKGSKLKPKINKILRKMIEEGEMDKIRKKHQIAVFD